MQLAEVVLGLRFQGKFWAGGFYFNYLEKLVSNILSVYCVGEQNRRKMLCYIKDEFTIRWKPLERKTQYNDIEQVYITAEADKPGTFKCVTGGAHKCQCEYLGMFCYVQSLNTSF